MTIPRPIRCLGLLSLLLLALSLACGGCTTRVNRENVFANTETGLGIFLAENPKTQLYELKVGWVRHELFWVPTSKFVRYADNGTEADNGHEHDPSDTPEVLAEITINGSTPGPAGKDDGVVKFELRQRLAVGRCAVQSGAAVALMADSDAKAQAVADYNASREVFLQQKEVFNAIMAIYNRQTDQAKKTRIVDKAADLGIFPRPLGEITDLDKFFKSHLSSWVRPDKPTNMDGLQKLHEFCKTLQ